MKIGVMHIIGIAIALLIAGLGFVFLSGNQRYFVFVVAAIFITLPFVISVVVQQSFEKEKR